MPAALNYPRNSAQALLLHLHRKHKTTLTGGCILVDMKGNISKRFKTYLHGFYRYYLAQPKLQNILVNGIPHNLMNTQVTY